MSLVEPSFIIASNEPGTLASFYGLLLECNTSKGINEKHFFINYKNLVQIEFYCPSRDRDFHVKYPPKVSICFKGEPSDDPLKVTEDWCRRVVSLGGVVSEHPINETFGAEVWLKDPEGNNFLIYIPLKD